MEEELNDNDFSIKGVIFKDKLPDGVTFTDLISGKISIEECFSNYFRNQEEKQDEKTKN